MPLASLGRRALARRFGFFVGFGLLAALPAWAEQRVVLYSANDDTVNKMVAGAFTKATGIDVDVVSAGSGVLFRRIASESARPQADVVWGTSASLLKDNSKYLEPYAAPEREAVPAQYRDPNNLWIGTNLQVLTINQNTKQIPDGAGPKSWADLTDPKWKGKIAYTDPANSGSSYVTATFLVSLWGGGDAGWNKLRDLLANTKVLNRSTLVFDGNGTGEYPLGIALEYAGYLWAHNGAPVAVTYPADGTVALAEGVGIVKGGPNPGPARALVDFVTGRAIQEELLRATFRRPARQDIDLSALPGHMKPLAQIKLMPYDDAQWEAARRDTLARLRTLVQDTR
jgi:iron(III) transport system substrate-binding protein